MRKQFYNPVQKFDVKFSRVIRKVLVSFRVVLLCELPEHWAARWRIVERCDLTYQLFGYVTVTCLNLTFSNTLLIDSWCSISENAKSISDHGFKCFSRSVVSTGKSGFVPLFLLCLF